MAEPTGEIVSQAELHNTIQKLRNDATRRIIARCIVGKLSKMFHLEQRWPNLSVPVVLLIILYMLGTGLAWLLSRRLIPWDTWRFVVAFVAALSLGIVSFLKDTVFDGNVESLLTSAADRVAFEKIEKWFNRFISWRQLPLPIVFGLLGTG